jgi:hypothetical protein
VREEISRLPEIGKDVTMKLVALFMTLALAGALAQERTTDRQPQKGDSIVVKGCLKGRSLESTETGLASSDVRLPTVLVYRLTGDKNVLKQLRDLHDGSVVEVSGILKSTLPPGDDLGTRTFGKTRVKIGVGSATVGSPANAEASRSLPVLEVKSYEGVAVKCGG